MVYGYARVSTKGQTDGNSLEAQEHALREAGATEIYVDSFTGKTTDRPEFNKLISKLQSGDTLLVTKLDRFARSMTQGTELVSELLDRGIKIHILNMGILDNTPTSTLIRNVFFAFAEFERAMIVERTQEGRAIARKKADYVEGRPHLYGRQQIDHALSLLNDHSYKQVERMTGISKSTLLRAKRKLNEQPIERQKIGVIAPIFLPLYWFNYFNSRTHGVRMNY